MACSENQGLVRYLCAWKATAIKFAETGRAILRRPILSLGGHVQIVASCHEDTKWILYNGKVGCLAE